MATRITNQKLSKSSRAWMREHLDDPFVKKAQKEGYRARAAYKLLEIQEKYKLIKPGMTVVDLGAIARHDGLDDGHDCVEHVGDGLGGLPAPFERRGVLGVLHQQEEFACGAGDIETSGEGKGSRDIEKEADDFATTLLMPLDDFRRQVDGETVSFDLLGHCADRYGVSLTAAAIRWLEIAPKRAVLVASRDDHMLWASSNEAAFKSGTYFATRKNTIELPRSALAHSRNCTGASQSHDTRAQVWFAREPAEMPITEMTKVAGNYGYTLTLLVMPEAEKRWRRRDEDEEPVEDSYDRFGVGGRVR